jgi:hypothetical protein
VVDKLTTWKWSHVPRMVPTMQFPKVIYFSFFVVKVQAIMGSRFIFIYMTMRMSYVYGLICQVEMVLVVVEPSMATKKEYHIHNIVAKSNDSIMEDGLKDHDQGIALMGEG